MMTEEELRLIDDYRFAHRIATRSGAIRDLVRHGLRRVELLDASSTPPRKPRRARIGEPA